ncbi:MAG: MBL fold metallo-hydrolase [Bacteroidales bacterium]|nr:MBL fold metallo-hydrolase [Bacteroidales bacterium]
MKFISGLILMLTVMQNNYADIPFGRDTISTGQGDMVITFIGHASLMFQFNGLVIHVDPVSQEADYSLFPKADIIIITHEHFDHFDHEALQKIMKEDTKVYLTRKCIEGSGDLGNAVVMKNGDTQETSGITIEAVPAYNIVHMRSPGKPFHPKGEGNGYILTLGNKRVYIAGDTENTPEMKALKDIDIAFLPMNTPYTMTPEMVADAVKAFKPAVLYPYHYGNTRTDKLLELLEKSNDTEVRIRDLQ